MEIYQKVLLGTESYLFINILVLNFIKRETRYEENSQNDDDLGAIIWIILVFGIFVLPFINRIRIYRKHNYLKNRIEYYHSCGSELMSGHIKRLERIYKVSKLREKSKRKSKIL